MTSVVEQSTPESLADDRTLRHELKDKEYRHAYAEDFLNTWVATQIVTLREQRGLSQAQFGELIGTKQPGVSRLEDVNHSTWKTETLKRIARALDVRLKISFETFGSLLDEDSRFSRDFLERPEFSEDPVFLERKGPNPHTSQAISAANNTASDTRALAISAESNVIEINAREAITSAAAGNAWQAEAPMAKTA